MADRVPGAPNVYRYQPIAVALGQQIVNTFDFVDVDAVDGAALTNVQMQNALLELRTRWEGLMLALLPNEYVLEGHILREITGVTYLPGPPVTKAKPIYDRQFILPPDDAVGDLAGVVLPTSLAASVKKSTATLSRYSTGGTRFGPLVEANVTDNELVGAHVTEINDAMAALTANIEYQEDPIKQLTHVVYSPTFLAREGETATNVRFATFVVTGMTTHSVVTTQRSRMPSLGGD